MEGVVVWDRVGTMYIFRIWIYYQTSSNCIYIQYKGKDWCIFVRAIHTYISAHSIQAITYHSNPLNFNGR